MAMRIFSREFKVEAVSLVQDHGVSIAKASRYPELNDYVEQCWIRGVSSDPSDVLSGHSQITD
jgi:transposase-like protein